MQTSCRLTCQVDQLKEWLCLDRSKDFYAKKLRCCCAKNDRMVSCISLALDRAFPVGIELMCSPSRCPRIRNQRTRFEFAKSSCQVWFEWLILTQRSATICTRIRFNWAMPASLSAHLSAFRELRWGCFNWKNSSHITSKIFTISEAHISSNDKSKNA